MIQDTSGQESSPIRQSQPRTRAGHSPEPRRPRQPRQAACTRPLPRLSTCRILRTQSVAVPAGGLSSFIESLKDKIQELHASMAGCACSISQSESSRVAVLDNIKRLRTQRMVRQVLASRADKLPSLRSTRCGLIDRHVALGSVTTEQTHLEPEA